VPEQRQGSQVPRTASVAAVENVSLDTPHIPALRFIVVCLQPNGKRTHRALFAGAYSTNRENKDEDKVVILALSNKPNISACRSVRILTAGHK
jgi:hypothetical protein